ncbi:MAG: hypothetical protein ACPHTD_06325, partial [Gammaproteobacteria bacterium]
SLEACFIKAERRWRGLDGVVMRNWLCGAHDVSPNGRCGCLCVCRCGADGGLYAKGGCADPLVR